MDKKMKVVTEEMKMAEKSLKKGKKKKALKTLHKAERENERLTKIDKEVRDPFIEKCEKETGKKIRKA